MTRSKRAQKKIARQENNSSKTVPQSAALSAASKSVGDAASPPGSDSLDRFTWSVSDLDHRHAGAWDWDLSPKEVRDFLDLLEQLGRCTWGEMRAQTTGGKQRRKLHHAQESSSLCAEAQHRLGELGIDDEVLFRLRHGATLRVWGRKVGSVFHVIWYDRNHCVYPTDPS